MKKNKFGPNEVAEKRYQKFLNKYIYRQLKKSILGISGITKERKNTFLAKREIKRFVNAINRKSKGSWHEYFNKFRGKDSKRLKKQMDRAIKKGDIDEQVRINFNLIKTIPKKILQEKTFNKKLRSIVESNLSSGQRYTEITKHLKAKGYKNAEVIARTESSKINSQFTQKRAKSLKIKAYIWKTANDRRVRESHEDMRDVIVFYNKRPIPGIYSPYPNKRKVHAGEDYQCRCIQFPISLKSQVKRISKNGYNEIWLKGKIRRVKTTEVLKMLEL